MYTRNNLTEIHTHTWEYREIAYALFSATIISLSVKL